MLQDPENPYEEWSDEVWASSLEDAQRQCQLMAGNSLTEVLQVTQKTRTPSRNGTFKFICWFRTEQTHDSDSNSDDTRN
jgi:hypothetical protein